MSSMQTNKVLLLAMGLVLMASRAPSQQQGASARVGGVIVNSTSQGPLAGVHVRLAMLDRQSSALFYGALTTPDGHFLIDKINPGAYTVTIEKQGFVEMPEQKADHDRVVVQAGAQVRLDLAMTPAAVLSGRVVDELGDPMMYAEVTAQPAGPHSREDEQQRMTNDLGEFQMSVVPGKYLLAAYLTEILPIRESRNDQMEGTEMLRYRNTFFPSTIRPAAATTVEGKAGSEVSGLEIHLVQTPLLSISGRLLGEPNKVKNALVTAAAAARLTTMGASAQASEARYSVLGLEPGRYRVLATNGEGSGQIYSGVKEVVLTDANVEGVDLVLAPGAKVNGSVLGPEKGKLKRYKVILSGTDLQVTNTNTTGRFRFESVAPDTYYVDVVEGDQRGLGRENYIQSVELNGSKSGRMVALRSGEAATLRIRISGNGGQLSGKVAFAKGANSKGREVWLAPDVDTRGHLGLRLSDISPKGNYTFHGLPPGAYRLGVFDSSKDLMDEDEVEDFIKDPSALVVTIKQGGKAVRDLKAEKGK